MRKNLFFRFVTFYSLVSILLQSLLPFFYAFPRSSFAQEVTPTSAAPTSTPEPTLVPTVEPTVVPTAEPTPLRPTDSAGSAGQAATITPTAVPTDVLTPTPKPTSVITPTTAPSPWTFEKVELNKEYRAPQNSGVKLTFTKLPSPSGNIKIAEITLTAEQIKQTGSLSDKAYDITSDMKDGEFTYNLSLPIPEASKGKEVNVKFAEELSTIGTAKEVTNSLTNTATSVSVKSLDHMTVFVVVYDATPSVSQTNYPSLGFQATQTSEFGDYIHLGGSDRLLNSVTVTMSDWAKYSDYVSDGRYSGNSTSWTHPITINIYGSELNTDGTPKTKLGTVTQTITIPWRPVGSSECPDTGYGAGFAWKSSDGTCYNGIAFNAVFDMSGLNLILPNDIIVGIAYNTNTYGQSPIGSNGPYESLNVAIPNNQPVTVGSDDSVGEVFWNTVTSTWYTDGGAAGYGVFRKDTNWTPNGTVAFKIETIDTTPACDSSSFDSFTLGSVNGQGGWSATGPFDQAIVKNSYGYSSFGCKSLRISDSVTSGSFGDQVFANPQVNGSGESSASIGGFTLGTRQNHFEAQFDIASAIPTQQAGMHISISPDRGDGSRMSYLRIEDNSGGLDVFFDDVQGTANPANFVETNVSTGLDRTVPHTLKFVMDFKDGPSNDIVEIWIDGTLVHTGTSWEDYYRYDSEASSEQSPRIVKTLLFRESGAATPANSGNGFLFDNINLASSIILPDTTAPAVPDLVSPADGIYRHTANTNYSDWSDVTDPSGVGYRYQSASDIGFSSLYYDSNDHGPLLTESTILNLGEPEVSYFWRVQACDLVGNCSAWTTPRRINIDNTAPVKPSGLKFQSQNRAVDFSCGTYVPLQVAIPDWNDIAGDLSFSHYEYTSFHPSGAIGLNEQVLTVSELYNTWMPPADGTYGYAVRAVDFAGNKSEWALSAKTLAGSCQIKYESIRPTVDLVFPAPGPSAKSFKAVFSENVNESEAENPANYFLENWPGAGGSGDLSGDATVVYDSSTTTATITLTNAGWYISPEQKWGVQNVHDLAGNLQQVNPYSEYSTSMVDPITTDSGTDTNWHNTSVTVSFTCTDVGGSGCKKTYYTTDGSTPTTSSTFGNSVTLSTDGVYTIRYFSIDNAGNEEDIKTASNTVKIDKTSPGIPVISTPTAEQHFKTSPILNQWNTITDTSGIKQYTIEYIYDDGHPFSGAPYRYTTSNSRNHSPGITEQGGVTIRVRAEDNAGNIGDWSSAVHYVYDATAPVLSCPNITTSNDVDFAGATVSFSGTATDAIDGSLPVSYSPTSGTFFPIGGTSVSCSATDAAGNTRTGTFNVTVNDTQYPTQPGTPTTTTPSATNTPTWIWTGSTDNAPGMYYIFYWSQTSGGEDYNSGNIGTALSFTHSSALAEGAWYGKVKAIDASGNTTESDIGSVEIDTVAPAVTSVSSDGATYNLASANPTIKITFSEDITNIPTIEMFSPVGDLQTVDDCSDSDAKTFCFTYSLNPEELTHTIHIYGSQDVAGNMMSLDTEHTFIVDRIAPIFASKTTFSGWYNTNQTSTFTYSDTNGIASGNNRTCDITTEGTDQTCSVDDINVCDTNGNCNTSSVTSNGANIDKTNPHSTITAPSNSGSGTTIYTNNWTGSILGTATDSISGVNGIQVSIQKGTTQYFNGTSFIDSPTEILLGANYADGNWDYALSSPGEGSYTIKSHAIDNATNMESTYTLTIIFDKTIPEVAISLNPAVADASNGWYKTQPEITLTATDAHMDIIQYQWDSEIGTWTTYSAPFKPGNEGAHVLYYRAHDLADNYSDTGVKNIKWNKTDLKEGPLNVNVSPNPTSESTSKVKWDAATSDTIGIDKYEVQWHLKGGDKTYTVSVGNGVREYTVDNLIEGVWEVKVTAFDASGNNKSASVDLTVDRTGPSAPTLSIFGTGPGSVSLSWSKIDGANNYIIWYGTNPGSYQYGAKIGDTQSYTVQGLGAGSYYFIVKAVDPSGNQSGNSNEVSTGAITGAPGVAENTPAQGFAEQVLGTNTLTPTPVPTGLVLGAKTNKDNKPWWWPWILLLLFPPGWFGYREWRKRRSIDIVS